MHSATSCMQDCDHHPAFASSASWASSAALLKSRSSRLLSPGTLTCRSTKAAACLTVQHFASARNCSMAGRLTARTWSDSSRCTACCRRCRRNDDLAGCMHTIDGAMTSPWYQGMAHSAQSLEHGVQSIHLSASSGSQLHTGFLSSMTGMTGPLSSETAHRQGSAARAQPRRAAGTQHLAATCSALSKNRHRGKQMPDAWSFRCGCPCALLEYWYVRRCNEARYIGIHYSRQPQPHRFCSCPPHSRHRIQGCSAQRQPQTAEFRAPTASAAAPAPAVGFRGHAMHICTQHYQGPPNPKTPIPVQPCYGAGTSAGRSVQLDAQRLPCLRGLGRFRRVCLQQHSMTPQAVLHTTDPPQNAQLGRLQAQTSRL